MPIEIEVPDLGTVEFPDDMPESEMLKAIEDQLRSEHPERIVQPPKSEFERLVTDTDVYGRPVPSVPIPLPMDFGEGFEDYRQREAKRADLAAQQFALEQKKPSLTPAEMVGGFFPAIMRGAATGAASALSGIGAMGEMTSSPEALSVAPGATFVPMPESIKEWTRRAQRTPSEVMRDIQASPMVRLGEQQAKLAGEFWAGPEASREALLTRAGEMIGGLMPYIISPQAAPVTIGLQEIGADITGEYELARQEGLSDDAAAERAMNTAVAKGGAQAAIFAVLPPALRRAGDKYLLDKIGQERVKQIIARRVAQVGEGAVVGGVSGAVSGQPLEGALGMAIMLGLTPRGITPKQRQDILRTREELQEYLAQKLIERRKAEAQPPPEPGKPPAQVEAPPAPTARPEEIAKNLGMRFETDFGGLWQFTAFDSLGRESTTFSVPKGSSLEKIEEAYRKKYEEYETSDPTRPIELEKSKPIAEQLSKGITDDQLIVSVNKIPEMPEAQYAQVDLMVDGKNVSSSNGNFLRTLGYDVPTTEELLRLPAGKYSMSEARRLLAQQQAPQAPQPIPENEIRDLWNTMGNENQRMLAKNRPDLAGLMWEQLAEPEKAIIRESLNAPAPETPAAPQAPAPPAPAAPTPPAPPAPPATAPTPAPAPAPVATKPAPVATKAPEVETKPPPAATKPAPEKLNKYGVTDAQWEEMAKYNDAEQMARWGTTMDALKAQAQAKAAPQAAKAPEPPPPAAPTPAAPQPAPPVTPPAPRGKQTITTKVLSTQKADLLAKVDAAIKAAPEAPSGPITFKIEGDGEYTVTNSKDTLKKFRDIVESSFPATVTGAGKPATLRAPKPTQLPKATTPAPAQIPEIVSDFTSADPERFAITGSYSDGTQVVATDGRQLIRVVATGVPGSPVKPVFITGKGKTVGALEGMFPNWKQVRDAAAELIYGGLNLKDIWPIIQQAVRFRDAAVLDKDKRGRYGIELFVNKDRSLGAKMDIVGDSFEHNLKPDAVSLGTYNPGYLDNALWTSAKLGNEKVDLYAHGGDSGPIGINGKNSEVLIMPMRISDTTPTRAPTADLRATAGKATHSQLPEGLGPAPSVDQPFTQHTDRGTTGRFLTKLQGDKVVFERLTTIKGYGRRPTEDVTNVIGEIPLEDVAKGKKSVLGQVRAIVDAHLGAKHSDAKGLANALVNDAEAALGEKRKVEREMRDRQHEIDIKAAMPPGPGAASPSEFAQRQSGAGRVPPGPNPPVAVGGEKPTPETVRKLRDFTNFNRFNSGQWAFYFGRLGQAAKAAWENMALAEFEMRESIQRDIQTIVNGPLKKLPRQFRKKGGKAFFELLDGRKLEEIESEWSGKPGGEVVIEQARIVKTRLENIRTTIRDIKRESYNRSLMSLHLASLEDLYRANIYPDTMGKTKAQLADALTLDQFPDDWGIADGGYLPHLFLGQWKVTVAPKGAESPQFAFRAQTAAEAKARIYEMSKSNPELSGAQWTVSQETVIPADMIRLGDRRFWNMIQRMKDQTQGAFDPKEAVQGIISRKSVKQKWFGSLQQRLGFQNYSRDFESVLKAYLSGFHRWRVLSALNSRVIPLIDQVRQEGRTNAENRLNELLDNLWGKPARVTMEFDSFIRNTPVLRDYIKPLALDRWSRFVTSLVSNLTLSTVRFALINRLQPLQGLYPIIGERLLVKAKIMQHTAEGRKLLDEAGVIFDPGQYAGETAGRGIFTTGLERIRGETSNQELAFLGMYLHGLEHGLSKAGAIRYGKLRGQLMTQFTPLIVDTPSIMEGPVGRVLFQFKRFPVKQVELMARMAADRNIPAIARLALVFASMGGLALLMRQTYSDYDRRLALQKKLREEFGERGADALYYGLPGLAGADLSGSLVLGDEPFGANVYEKTGRLLAGPAISLGLETGRAIRTKPREPISATEKALVVAKKIPALRAISELVDLARGQTDLLGPDGEVKYERALSDVLFGLGSFRSANESNIQIAKNAIMELDREIGDLKNAAWVAHESGDQARIQDAAEAIADFNKRWPEASIQRREINEYFKYRRRKAKETKLERTAGRQFEKLLPRD